MDSWKSLLASVVFTVSHGAAVAEDDVAGQFNAARAKLVQSDMMQRKVMGTVYQINQKMKAVSFRRSRLSDEMMYLNNKIKKLARSLAELEEQVSSDKVKLSRRLRAMYMLGGQGLMRVLFSSSTSHDFDRNLRFLKSVADKDFKVIKSYISKKKRLVAAKEKLRKKVAKLVVVRKKVGMQEKALESQQKAKHKLLTQFKQQRQRQLARIKNIRNEKETVRVNPELAALLNSTFFARKGKLDPPVEGVVATNYGVLEDNEFGFRLSHKGQVYAGEKDAPVNVIHDGQVAYSGKLPGYGHVVIVDHSDHYFTVYGSLARVIVDRGETVRTGEMIARLGTKRNEDHGSMYFEIRHFSDSVNPANWLRKEI